MNVAGLGARFSSRARRLFLLHLSHSGCNSIPNIAAPDRLGGGEHFTLPLADTESGKIKSKAALRICVIVIKELRRTRKNDLRRK